MLHSGKISTRIKQLVQQTVPDAKVLLFGSRADGSATEESDWDILVLTKRAVNAGLKKTVLQNIFPLSVEIGSFINLLMVQEQDWHTNPSYYSLQQTIRAEDIPA